MGWLFGWQTRKQLVKHLIEENGVKTLKSCSVGNNLWCVHECTCDQGPKAGEVIRYACLYLIKGPAFGNPNDRYGWGYKDVDESMGPNRDDFPASWLELLSPITSEYAVEWRARVKARGEKIKSMTTGTKWERGGTIYEIIVRRSPTLYRVKDLFGDTWRIPLTYLLQMERI